MKKYIMIVFLLISYAAVAQNNDTLQIHTSAVCKTCKSTLENDISFVKGVKSVKLDVKSAMLTVIFDPAKTTPEKIRVAVTKSGYDADTLKRDEKAFRSLPDCCKKPHLE